jgi:hypothetical protein
MSVKEKWRKAKASCSRDWKTGYLMPTTALICGVTTYFASSGFGLSNLEMSVRVGFGFMAGFVAGIYLTMLDPLRGPSCLSRQSPDRPEFSERRAHMKFIVRARPHNPDQ